MLHAVAGGLAQVVGNKGVAGKVKRWQLAENGFFFLHHLLDFPGVGIQLRRRAQVQRGQLNGLVTLGPRAHLLRPQRHRTVHEVLHIGGRKRGFVRAGAELGGRFPARGQVEFYFRRAVFQARGVAQRGRQVEVGVLLVNAHKGAIGLVAVQGVAEEHRAVGGRGHVPAVLVGPVEGQGVVAAVGGHHVVYVFGKVMQRVAAG